MADGGGGGAGTIIFSIVQTWFSISTNDSFGHLKLLSVPAIDCISRLVSISVEISANQKKEKRNEIQHFLAREQEVRKCEREKKEVGNLHLKSFPLAAHATHTWLHKIWIVSLYHNEHKKFIPRFLSPVLLRTEFRRLRRLCPAKQTTVINMPREINIKNTPPRNASTFKLPAKRKGREKEEARKIIFIK